MGSEETETRKEIARVGTGEMVLGLGRAIIKVGKKTRSGYTVCMRELQATCVYATCGFTALLSAYVYLLVCSWRNLIRTAYCAPTCLFSSPS